jgi:hypothetical protein
MFGARLIGLVVLVGCGGDARPPDCATVGDGIRKYWNDVIARSTDPEEQAAARDTAQRGASRMEQHCRADQWNPELITCARAVFRLDDSGCFKFMSDSQRRRWEAEADPGIQLGR